MNSTQQIASEKLGVRVVCISDTHGDHDSLTENFPSGDVLIHAGDFTRMGRYDDVVKFNLWLAKIKSQGGFQHIVVVNGNHENNAPWKRDVERLLDNATFLRNSDTTLIIQTRATAPIPTLSGSSPANHCDSSDANDPHADEHLDRDGMRGSFISSGSEHTRECTIGGSPEGRSGASIALRVFGTDFFWPMFTTNPHYDAIPHGVDVLVSHNPCLDRADGGRGCPTLLQAARRVAPRLVVSGHVHSARGLVEPAVGGGPGLGVDGTTYVNAACCKGDEGYKVWWTPIVVDL